MKFKMSPNVAVRTQHVSDALDFYSKVLGFANRSTGPGQVDLDANPINLFIIQDHEISGAVMELFVDNLDEARDELLAHGCKVLRWHGKGQDCYIQDPFGVVFNLWESTDSD